MRGNLTQWLGGTAYQIFPDRFYRSSDTPLFHEGRVIKSWDDRMPNWKPNDEGIFMNDYFYGGDLKGITSKLDYLKDLGISIIYLTPIGRSSTYHHYDPENHMELDPFLGTWEDFSELCETAHKKDILVIVDMVFNHTGINSIYVKDERYYDWFERNDEGNYCGWSDFMDLPQCNKLNKEYQKAMKAVAEKYLAHGADGLRLDLGENLPKEFLMTIAEVKEKYPKTLIIGEMWGIATNRGEDAKIFNGELDSVMNYVMADAILRWVHFGNHIHFSHWFNRVYNEYPIDVQNCLLNNIGTHDTPTTMIMVAGKRMNEDVFSGWIWDIEKYWKKEGEEFNTFEFRQYEADNDKMYGEEYEIAKKLTKIAIAIMYFIPGIPCLYQGTEIAETGYKDPFNRKPYDWNKREEGMRDFVRAMGNIRKYNRDLFATGSARILALDERVLVMERFLENERIVLAVNRVSEGARISLQDIEVVYNSGGCTREYLPGYGVLVAKEH